MSVTPCKRLLKNELSTEKLGNPFVLMEVSLKHCFKIILKALTQLAEHHAANGIVLRLNQLFDLLNLRLILQESKSLNRFRYLNLTW